MLYVALHLSRVTPREGRRVAAVFQAPLVAFWNQQEEILIKNKKYPHDNTVQDCAAHH